MTPFISILIVTAAIAVGCFIIAWLDIAVHHKSRTLPSPQEMRRHMLCGFYCNPEDPRPVVHRPAGRGYTINLRREQLVLVLVVMTVLAMLVAALMYWMSTQST